MTPHVLRSSKRYFLTLPSSNTSSLLKLKVKHRKIISAILINQMYLNYDDQTYEIKRKLLLHNNLSNA